MKYFNVHEASDFLGITPEKVRYLYGRKTFADTLMSGRALMISMTDLLEYKKQLDLLSELYSITEVGAILGFSYGNLSKHYVKKGFFKTLQVINNRQYIAKTELHNLLEQNKEYYEMTDYKTAKEVAVYLNLHVETIYRYIKRGAFPNAKRLNFNDNFIWKIPNQDIRSFQLLLNSGYKWSSGKSFKVDHSATTVNYYTVQEVADYYGVSPNTVHTRVREGLFKDIKTVGLKRYIGKKEVHTTHAVFIKEKLDLNATFEDKLLFYTRKVKNAELMSETINNFKSYLEYLMGNTRMRKKHYLLNAHCNMLIDLSQKLKKELHEHTDKEISHLITLTSKMRKQLVGFINYTLVTKSSQCKFQNKYNYTSKNITQTDKHIYSKQDFKKMYLYVNDISIHIEKALSKQEYAETWFYVFMHMTNAWRSSDIKNFPCIDLSGISQEYIDTIFTNGITIADAQAITNIVSEQWESFVNNKKGVLNKFLVNIDAVQTASTIFITLELHKRRQSYNGKYLLPILQRKSNSFTPYINNLFEADATLKPFSSRIANRSLMTYFFHSVTKGANNGDVAHLLAQRLRRHTSQDSIGQYIMNINGDGYLDDVSYNLFRRGHFGWLYNSLVEIVVNKQDMKLTNEEKTIIIESYQEQYSPSMVEEISSYFLKYQNKNQSVALEIALLPEEELKSRLFNIYKGIMPSKEENSQCFYSENCKNPMGSCKTCYYVIPKTHLLISLKHDLKETISQIKVLKEYDIYERIRKTHILYKLLNLVTQAIRSYDRAYVSSFIPLDVLHSNLVEITEMIYLTEKGDNV